MYIYISNIHPILHFHWNSRSPESWLTTKSSWSAGSVPSFAGQSPEFQQSLLAGRGWRHLIGSGRERHGKFHGKCGNCTANSWHQRTTNNGNDQNHGYMWFTCLKKEFVTPYAQMFTSWSCFDRSSHLWALCLASAIQFLLGLLRATELRRFFLSFSCSLFYIMF